MIRPKRLVSLIFLFVLLASFQGLAQEEQVAKDSIQGNVDAFEIGEIAQQTERLGQRIIRLKKDLGQSKDISEIDSVLIPMTEEIASKLDTTPLNLDELTARDLKVQKVEWDGLKSVLGDYQETIQNRTEEISKITNELFLEIKRWEASKKTLVERSSSSDIVEGIDRAVGSLEETMSVAHVRLDSVFVIQKRVTDLVLLVDEQISKIEAGAQQKQKDFFAVDAPPLWQDLGTIEQDSTLLATEPTTVALLKEGLRKNKHQFVDYAKLNVNVVVMQFVFLILMYLFMFLVNRKWRRGLATLKNPIEIQAKLILKNPLLSTLSAGTLITAFFFDSMVPSFSELLILVVLISTTILLPRLTVARFKTFLWILFLSYLLSTFLAFMGPKATMVRWLLLVNAFMLLTALYLGRKIVMEHQDIFKSIFRFFKYVSVVYMAILVVAVIGNVFGMVSFAAFLTQGVMLSTALGMVVVLTVKVLSSLIFMIFKVRRASNIQTLDALVQAMHQRIQPTFHWIGMIFWVIFTLNSFGIYEYLVNWWNELLLIKWNIGEMTISMGGVLAFVMIFIITMIIAKIGAAIFQDEWMVKVLPRGVAPAISLVLRILVVTLGLYAGLTAAGVDLSKLGFVLGALGVGIGFGLQNVVLNFVSGLILAFERPINLGDTIEVDMEKGVVTNIGVRSSNIRTYSGAEVIVPNGDLISKKVINWTLSNRERRSRIPMKTSANADPEVVIELFNSIAKEHPSTLKNPEPKTYFYGYGPDGNLNFALMYWTTFSDTLRSDSEIALSIFKALKERDIQAPVPVRRIISED